MIVDDVCAYRIYFERIYTSHYARMRRFAQLYIHDEKDAENIVQDIFMDIWEKQNELTITENITAYLFTTTKNRCINLLRKRVIKERVLTTYKEEEQAFWQSKLNLLTHFETETISDKYLEELVNSAIAKLPEKCREIFIKSKLEGKKQKQIANELNISINTVEAQMSIAYKKLKEILKESPNIDSFLR